MIRNVFGKAVTKSTVVRLPEYEGESVISREEMAMVALALKSSQGKEDDEAVSYVERLRDQCARDETRFTLGWIYNATGGAITLVDSRDLGGGGCLVSNPYPVRIENGQWGMLLHKAGLYGSSAAILYEGLNSDRKICYWCVAWTNPVRTNSKVRVKIVRDVDWYEEEWGKELGDCGSQHRANQEGWVSVISASPGPEMVFEALLTLEDL